MSSTTAEQSANGAANSNTTNSNPITAPLNQAAHEIEKIAGFPISTIHTGAIILIGTGLAAFSVQGIFSQWITVSRPAAQQVPATGTYPILNIETTPANNGNSKWRTVYTNPPRRPVIIKPRPQQQQQQQQQRPAARRPTAIESEDEQDEFLSNPDPVEPVQVANYPIHDVSTQEHPPAAAKFPKVPERSSNTNTVNYNINGGFDDYDED